VSITAALTIAGMSINFLSSISGYQDKLKQASVQKVNALNAQIAAENNAALARRAGKRRRGAQRAAFAHAGVDVNTGSALAVQTATALETEIRAQALLIEGENASREFFARSSTLRSAGRGELISGFGSLVSAAGEYARL